MNPFTLPDFDSCEQALQEGNGTPIDLFIYDNEPAGSENYEDFRKELSILIEYVYQKGLEDGKS